MYVLWGKDNTREAADHVLYPKAVYRNGATSYWSSAGNTSGTSNDSITFRLAHNFCILHRLEIRPFQAKWQQVAHCRSWITLAEDFLCVLFTHQWILEGSFAWCFNAWECFGKFAEIQKSPRLVVCYGVMNVRCHCLRMLCMTLSLQGRPIYAPKGVQVSFSSKQGRRLWTSPTYPVDRSHRRQCFDLPPVACPVDAVTVSLG